MKKLWLSSVMVRVLDLRF